MADVTLPTVGVSLSCGVSLATSTPVLPFAGESLLGLGVQIGSAISTSSPGGTNSLAFNNATNSQYIALIYGFP